MVLEIAYLLKLCVCAERMPPWLAGKITLKNSEQYVGRSFGI